MKKYLSFLLIILLSLQCSTIFYESMITFDTSDKGLDINQNFHTNLMTNYQVLSLNSSTSMHLSNQQPRVIYFTVNNTSNISIYSVSLFDTSVKVYEIGDMIRMPPKLISMDDNSGYNLNFRVDMIAEAYKIYMIEITLQTTLSYPVPIKLNLTESLFCWGDESNYTLGYSSVQNNYVFYNYSSQYSNHIDFAISIWNNLGAVQFIKLPDYGSFIDLYIDDFYSPSYGPAFYQKKFDSVDSIRLNTFYLDSWSNDEIVKTLLHELGHSLGITMDNYILSEDEVNVMIQGKRNLTHLGPCDILVYQNIYGE